MEHLHKAGLVGANCVPHFVVVAAMLFKRDVRVNSLHNHNRHTHKHNSRRLRLLSTPNSLVEGQKGRRAISSKNTVPREDAKGVTVRGYVLLGVEADVCPDGVRGAL